MIKCTLSYCNMQLKSEFNLSEHLTDMSSLDISTCAVVFEDGSYEIYFVCDQYKRTEVNSVEVYVNGEQVGTIAMKTDTTIVEGFTKYKVDIYSKQPFLLHYDIVTLSFILILADGSSKEYFSDFLLCVSKSKEDVINITNMIQELIEFNDSQVGEWIFSKVEHGAGTSLFQGKWNKRAYKSLSSYIQLLEQIITCYTNNYAYFKIERKHAIKYTNILTPYRRVKKVSRDSFNWIVNNMDQLSNIPYMSGIQYHRKNYLPYHIKTNMTERNYDVYENRIIVSFLYTVLLNVRRIFDEFNNNIVNEECVISRIHGRFPKEYKAPIITIKSLQIAFCRILLKKLSYSYDILQNLYNQYVLLFDVKTDILSGMPRKTCTFCEMRHYAQIFEIIVHWFQYGDYAFDKERLLLQVKTLDKLFEYYCLLCILKLLADNGYRKTNIKEPVLKYNYISADEHYQNEKDLANTYILTRNNVEVTLYYQPVISAIMFENNLTLFRTTMPSFGTLNYYTPDFVLKFSSSQQNEEYVIFDAKFSSRTNIKKYCLPDVIRKYSCEICSVADNRAPKMVWIFQGRVNNSENVVWYYHNSRLALRYRPTTSFGIISINTVAEFKQRLWNEIKKNISLIQ